MEPHSSHCPPPPLQSKLHRNQSVSHHGVDRQQTQLMTACAAAMYRVRICNSTIGVLCVHGTFGLVSR
eukprot:scaffold40469_cov72-Cyclotella_meneghiniana.AAC.4